jgi:glycosyltransferase involved in cell wall biosynthesis
MLGIAILCKTLLKGGAEKQALILARSLQEKNINVCIVSWYQDKIDPENLRYIQGNGIRYFPLEGGLISKLLSLRRLLKYENTGYIVSYLTLANIVAGISKLMGSNMKTIGGIRNEKLPFYKFAIERFIHNYINDVTVFNNYSGKEKFRKRGFNPDKIHVIQNAIEIDNHRPNEEKEGGNEIKIVTVGRFVKQKDYPTALKSFKFLKDKCRTTRFRYIIIGYGPLENEIRSIAHELEITSDIEIMINPPHIPEILRSSDIFLSTSLFEGVSNAIMEAMVAGLPIVATEVGDNKHLIRNSFNGYLVPCKNTGLVVQKLVYLCESEEKRRTFGNNSRLILERDFSMSLLVDNYISLFQKIGGDKNQ